MITEANTQKVEGILTNYLNHHCPFVHVQNGFNLTRINGGMVNYVYRVTLKDGPSYVIKHYQPFLSSEPDVPLSCERYFVEKVALNEMADSGAVFHVPKLVHFYDDDHILLMQDCGEGLLSLFELLSSDSVRSQGLNEVKPLLIRILNGLKELFFHLQDFSSQDSFLPMKFYSKGTMDVIRDYIYGEYETRIKAFPLLSKYLPYVEAERRTFEQRYDEFFQNSFRNLPARYSLTFGDMWPNAVFFPAEWTVSENIFFIDWEFTRIGHYYNDFFQLFAYLFLMENDIKYNFDHIQFLKDSLLHFLMHDPSSLPERGGITDENVSLLLVNTVLVLNDDRWNYRESKEMVCEKLIIFIDSLLDYVQRKEKK